MNHTMEKNNLIDILQKFRMQLQEDQEDEIANLKRAFEDLCTTLEKASNPISAMVYLNGKMKIIENTISTINKNNEERPGAIRSLVKIINNAKKYILDDQLKQAEILSGDEYYEEMMKEKLELINQKNEILSELVSKGFQNTPEYDDIINQIAVLKQEAEEYRIELESSHAKSSGNAMIEMRVEKFIKSSNISFDLISTEKTRLHWTFLSYAILIVVLVLFLLFWEIKIAPDVTKLIAQERPLLEFVPKYLPIPLCGCLLWAFIYQLNHIQRHLISISVLLHKLKYTNCLIDAISGVSAEPKANELRLSKMIGTLVDNYTKEVPMFNDLPGQNKDILEIPTKIVDMVAKLKAN